MMHSRAAHTLLPGHVFKTSSLDIEIFFLSIFKPFICEFTRVNKETVLPTNLIPFNYLSSKSKIAEQITMKSCTFKTAVPKAEYIIVSLMKTIFNAEYKKNLIREKSNVPKI